MLCQTKTESISWNVSLYVNLWVFVYSLCLIIFMLLCVDIVDIVDTQGKSQYEPTQTLAGIVEPELT